VRVCRCSSLGVQASQCGCADVPVWVRRCVNAGVQMSQFGCAGVSMRVCRCPSLGAQVCQCGCADVPVWVRRRPSAGVRLCLCRQESALFVPPSRLDLDLSIHQESCLNLDGCMKGPCLGAQTLGVCSSNNRSNRGSSPCMWKGPSLAVVTVSWA
jgi:hypothetical protein